MGHILYIGNTQVKEAAFLEALAKRYDVLTARSGKQGVDMAREHRPDVIVLDAVSMNTTGERVSRTLRAALGDVPIIHIHPGPRGEARSAADVMLFRPLSARRLLNSVGGLLHEHEEEVIDCGPFRLNVPRRILVVHGEEIQLSPKLALLIETFLRHPGETMDRKTLMEKVWDTDYLGDTRTLDVHIRWMREVMENGGSRPRYLQTVRGVGYRLVIPEMELSEIKI